MRLPNAAGYARFTYLLLAAGVLLVMPLTAQAQPAQISFTIHEGGIVDTATTPLDGGLYIVTVKNDSSRPSGVVMTGIDRGVSPYIRFTKVLQPGEQQRFRWYFPSDRDVKVRDLLKCYHVERTCMAAVVGGRETSLVFG